MFSGVMRRLGPPRSRSERIEEGLITFMLWSIIPTAVISAVAVIYFEL